MGAVVPDAAAAPANAVPGAQAGADDGNGSRSRWPLIAGMTVTLAILIFGGGFLWWRNRDSAYWPA